MVEPYPSRRTERALTRVMSHHADDNAVNRSMVFDAVAAHGLNLYYIRVNTLGSSLNSGLRAMTSTAALMQPDDCWPTPSESRESQDTARTPSALRTGPVTPTELAGGSEESLADAQQRQLDAPAIVHGSRCVKGSVTAAFHCAKQSSCFVIVNHGSRPWKRRPASLS